MSVGRRESPGFIHGVEVNSVKDRRGSVEAAQPLRGVAAQACRRSVVGNYLVVANQTLGGDQLIAEVRQRVAAGPSSFYVLVPNTQLSDSPGPGPAGLASSSSADA